MKNYAMAVTGAMGLTASLKYAAKVGPPVVQRLGAKPWAVPYLAVALSGSANIFFTRMSEMDRGVPVSLEDGTVVGTSKAAARTAAPPCPRSGAPGPRQRTAKYLDSREADSGDS